MSNLYRGTFNVSREITTLYTHSDGEAQAKLFFVRQLSHIYGRSVRFFSNKNNYEIEQIKESEA